MTARVLQAALLGYGYVGRTFHAAYIDSLPEWNLRGIVSSRPDEVRADRPDCLIYAEPHEAFADPDIDLVVIATPNETHFPLACAALEAGKHVLLEKPFALSLHEAREIIATAKRCNRELCVFHNRRWDSDYLSIRAALDRGDIGQIRHFESSIDRFRPHVRNRWRESARPGAGVLFDIGPHLIDQVLQIFGLPEQVYASVALQRDNTLSDDWAHLMLDYGPTRVILHTGSLAAGGTIRFKVHGTGGTLIKKKADPQENQLRDGMKPGDAGWGEDPDKLQIYTDETTSYEREAIPGDQRVLYRELGLALAGKGHNPIRPIEALATMAVIEAAVLSAQDKRAILLPLSEDEKSLWNEAYIGSETLSANARDISSSDR